MYKKLFVLKFLIFLIFTACSEDNSSGFGNVEAFIVNYTVHSASDNINAVSMALAWNGYGTVTTIMNEITTDKYYGAFETVLTKGIEEIGVTQCDTIFLDSRDFYLQFAGNTMADSDVMNALGYTADGDTCYLQDNLQALYDVQGLEFKAVTSFEESTELDFSISNITLMERDLNAYYFREW